MRNRRRHVYNFVGSSLDSIARTANRNSLLKRLGLDRRHIVFGLIVLFLCSISTSVYIYHKHWTITTTSPGGKAQRERTISVQMEPPMVTWPVRKAKRGRSTRMYGGADG